MSDKFAGHTHVNIKKLNIISLASRRTIDIRSVVLQLEIFGSIFEPTMCGSISLNDGSSEIQNLPLIGEELLDMEIESPGREPIKRIMHIHYPEGQEFDPNGTHVSIRLHFTSIDTFPGSVANISRGFKDNISKMVPAILKDFTGSTQKVVTEETKGIEHLVIPSLNAWKTIEFLRSRAVSQRYSSPFLFFEDQEGYNFMSYEYLIEQRKKMANELIFTNEPYLPDAGEAVVKRHTVLGRQYRNVDQFVVEQKSNAVNIAKEGGGSSRTIAFDIFEKKVKNIDVSYDDSKKVIKNPLGKRYEQGHSDGFFKSKNPTRNFMMPLDNTNPHALVDQYGERNLYTSILKETKITFTAPGDSQLQPGDVFKFIAPGRVNSKEPDVQLTGNYIIANIRHGIHSGQMFTTIDGYKCGLEEKII